MSYAKNIDENEQKKLENNIDMASKVKEVSFREVKMGGNSRSVIQSRELTIDEIHRKTFDCPFVWP